MGGTFIRRHQAKYVQQFSPVTDVDDGDRDNVDVRDTNLERNIETIDAIEEEDLEENPETEEEAQLQFLHQFTYDQDPQPKKKDVIY